jgi:hypothetical protein
MTLHQETTRSLIAFLNDEITSQELKTWIVSIEEDESFSIIERDDLGGLRLLLVETEEGLRPIEHARAEAMKLLNEADFFHTSSTSVSQTVGSPPPNSISVTAGSAA